MKDTLVRREFLNDLRKMMNGMLLKAEEDHIYSTRNNKTVKLCLRLGSILNIILTELMMLRRNELKIWMRLKNNVTVMLQ